LIEAWAGQKVFSSTRYEPLEEITQEVKGLFNKGHEGFCGPADGLGNDRTSGARSRQHRVLQEHQNPSDGLT